jgi:hypothetical protein
VRKQPERRGREREPAPRSSNPVTLSLGHVRRSPNSPEHRAQLTPPFPVLKISASRVGATMATVDHGRDQRTPARAAPQR